MRKFLLALMAVLALPYAHAIQAAPDSERTIKEIQFARGASTATVKGNISGYHYVDYRLSAGAGQKMKVSLQVSNRANYFNLLPPESTDAAMFIAGAGDTVFDGLLPDDGSYTIRVYLMRSAARRKESSNYTLSVSITGKALPPVSAKVDALIPGTRYHAKGTVNCAPPYTKTRECEALVIRRGFDGTATVELRWDQNGKRRILFVKGKPEAADAPQPFTSTRNERGWTLVFNGDERFEIPEPFVFGG